MPTLLRWAVTGGLLLRAMFLRFLVPPRPEFLVSRRTPFIDDATSEYYTTIHTVLSAFTTHVRLFFGLEYTGGGGGWRVGGRRRAGEGRRLKGDLINEQDLINKYKYDHVGEK